MDKTYDIRKRTYNFALLVLQLIKTIPYSGANKAVIDQISKSCTSMAANLHEGEGGSSKKDFIRFNFYSLKSGKETKMWLCFIRDLKLLDSNKINALITECTEITKIVAQIIINSKKTIKHS